MDHSLDQQLSSDSGSGQSCRPILLAADDRSSEQAAPNSSRPVDQRTRRFWIWAVCGFLVLAIGLVFGQTVSHQFLGYDDDGYVYKNPHVTAGLTLSGLWWALTDGPYGEWYPLTSLTHMLDCQLYGLNPAGHFVTNVLLHAVSSVLLFLVLLRMTGNLWPSAWVAAVFAIHPLHVESVAWLAERRDVLSGLFFMLTLGAYALYAQRPSWCADLGVAGMFALGLMAKPMLVTVPCVLLLLDYWPLDRFRRLAGADREAASRSWFGRLPVAWRRVVEKIPLLVLVAVNCGIALWTHASLRMTDRVDGLALGPRVANALVAYVAYLGQSLVPVNLSPYYPHLGTHLPIAWAAEALVLLLAITAVAAFFWRRRPYLLVGWLWYLGMLVPVIGLVGAFIQARADRYTYLSQIGLSIALAWGVWSVYQSRQSLRPASWRRWTLGVASGAAILLLAGVAWRQTSYWRDAETLWTRAAACTEQNLLAHYNLADICIKLGKTDEAIAHLRQAVSFHSLYREMIAGSHDRLADQLAEQGNTDEAFAHYQQAVRVYPTGEWPHARLATVLAAAGRHDEAIAEWRETVRVAPTAMKPRISLAVALLARGDAAEAADQCREVLRQEPELADAIEVLGAALAAEGNSEQAISSFERALQLDPRDARAHLHLGRILFDRRQSKDALAHLDEAVRLAPDNVSILWRTAWVLATSPDASVRNGSRAVDLATKAIELSAGQEPHAFDARAAALAETGQFAEAIDTAEQASTIALLRNDQALADAIDQRVKLYRQGLPYRQPPPAE